MKHHLSADNSIIAKMARNSTVANLIVLLLVFGGYFAFTATTKEVLPDFSDDNVIITVSYSDTSAAQIDKSIILPIENALSGIEGVEELSSEAQEGLGTVIAKLSGGKDHFVIYQDIKNMVDRLTNLPLDAGKPLVSLSRNKSEVVKMMLYGDVSRKELKKYTNQVYDYLSNNKKLGSIEIKGLSDSAIYIEVPQHRLSKYEIGIRDIAKKIQNWVMDSPSGVVRSEKGDILLQVDEGREIASEYGDIPIMYSEVGSSLPLKNIASITEGLVDNSNYADFNGKHAAIINIFRSENQTPVEVSEEVSNQLNNIKSILPKQIGVKLLDDRSKVFSQRAELLKNNGLIGFVLVVVILGLFMGLRFASWVGVSIPIVFLGTFLFFPGLDLSIDLVTMFAFIISLGIVVDDAIIIGENVFSYRNRGYSPLDAAILGAKEVASPVTYSVLTNIVAFLPLFFVPGIMGKVFVYIPAVVVIIFIISLLESLFVLPAHLAGVKIVEPRNKLVAAITEWQHKFNILILQQSQEKYQKALDKALDYRYLVLSLVFSIFIIIVSLTVSGRMGAVLFSDIESDVATATVSLAPGVSQNIISDTQNSLYKSAEMAVDAISEPNIVEGIFIAVEGNEVKAKIYLVDASLRNTSTSDVVAMWKHSWNSQPFVEAIKFSVNEKGPASDSDLTIELKNAGIEVLQHAAFWLGEEMARYKVLSNINDGASKGRLQWDFKLNQNAIAMGFNTKDISSQIRSAFYGYKVLEQFRGRDNVSVYVRLPESERDSNYDINNFILRTPSNAEVLLKDVVVMDKKTINDKITRRNGLRVVTVTAAAEPKSETINVQKSLEKTALAEMQEKFPGVNYSFEGKQADMLVSVNYLLLGFLFAVGGMYALLVISFSSFTRPILIFFMVPFSFIGVAAGNYIMGYPFSVLSLFGMIALTGIVINNGLVLLKFMENNMKNTKSIASAISDAAVRRLFPVFLTSITTFVGLLPMILERSMQARFLIPMAIALGFGALGALILTLFVLPVLYLILEDVKKFFGCSY